MSTGMLVLTVVAVLVFFGVAQRVLDRMRLTDRQALLLVADVYKRQPLDGWVTAREIHILTKAR